MSQTPHQPCPECAFSNAVAESLDTKCLELEEQLRAMRRENLQLKTELADTIRQHLQLKENAQSSVEILQRTIDAERRNVAQLHALLQRERDSFDDRFRNTKIEHREMAEELAAVKKELDDAKDQILQVTEDAQLKFVMLESEISAKEHDRARFDSLSAAAGSASGTQPALPVACLVNQTGTGVPMPFGVTSETFSVFERDDGW